MHGEGGPGSLDDPDVSWRGPRRDNGSSPVRVTGIDRYQAGVRYWHLTDIRPYVL